MHMGFSDSAHTSDGNNLPSRNLPVPATTQISPYGGRHVMRAGAGSREEDHEVRLGAMERGLTGWNAGGGTGSLERSA